RSAGARCTARPAPARCHFASSHPLPRRTGSSTTNERAPRLAPAGGAVARSRRSLLAPAGLRPAVLRGRAGGRHVDEDALGAGPEIERHCARALLLADGARLIADREEVVARRGASEVDAGGGDELLAGGHELDGGVVPGAVDLRGAGGPAAALSDEAR